MFDTAGLVERGAVDQAPRLFHKGEQQIPEGVEIARVSATGNRYAQTKHLEAKLVAEGAAMGADFVVATHQEVLKDQWERISGSRRGLVPGVIKLVSGHADTVTISRPVLHGMACRRATASLGAIVDNNGEVKFVRRGSAAEEAGLQEGMQLLAINETFIQSDRFVFAREVFSRNPGDMVQIDAITADRRKVRIAVRLEKPAEIGLPVFSKK
jgi:membrane-associated protease RseP (regulator of RpoE activity)